MDDLIGVLPRMLERGFKPAAHEERQNECKAWNRRGNSLAVLSCFAQKRPIVQSLSLVQGAWARVRL
ncbi:hypothetical protein [Cohnella sp. GCM10012308]|uniref:hypothetical protein n=1 Tax=Cohnella sp. GCM10012308 TaxID=3317329 RepID=UPI00362259EC